MLADEAKRNLAVFGQGYMQTPDFGQFGRQAPIGARREKVAEAMYGLITSLADVGARIGAPSSAGVR